MKRQVTQVELGMICVLCLTGVLGVLAYIAV